MFASDDENERHLWVQAMYRATGQAHKPQPPATLTVTNTKAPANSPLSRLQGGTFESQGSEKQNSEFLKSLNLGLEVINFSKSATWKEAQDSDKTDYENRQIDNY